jgi:hypothetical protein
MRYYTPHDETQLSTELLVEGKTLIRSSMSASTSRCLEGSFRHIICLDASKSI